MRLYVSYEEVIICIKTLISSSNLFDSDLSWSTFLTAWITVVWSRPPNFLPISGNYLEVNFFDKYIAIWRGLANDLIRLADIISSTLILK